MVLTMDKICLSIFVLNSILAIALGQAPARSTESGKEDIKHTGPYLRQSPPNAHYRIECSIDPDRGLLEGRESIYLKNRGDKSLHRLQIKWSSLGQMDITCKGEAVRILTEPEERSDTQITSVELPAPIRPGEEVKLEIKFSGIKPAAVVGDKMVFLRWHPSLWWGFETHDNFDVKIAVPEGYKVVTGGVLDAESGSHHAEGVRLLGLILYKDLKTIEAYAGDVLVRCLYTSKGEKCAQLLLETAVDVINFYRERFGFYPYQYLTIVPGMDRPAGGFPVATGIVAIHGMERMAEKPELHWKWITAHEIGHQYWGEYVLSEDPDDSFDWLMIGLGIYADREYVRARGLGLDNHRSIMNRYIKGLQSGLDTTIRRSAEQRAKVTFDYNNVVKHGKSFGIISALDCVLGKRVFGRIYRQCLKESSGRRLGVRDFQTVCEKEAAQDLGWFFDQWVNSNKFLSYEVSSKKCDKQDDHYISQVEVKCLGDLKMPVPVVAYFEDGTSQSKFTDRLLHSNVVEFKSKSPLKQVRLDPEEALAQASME